MKLKEIFSKISLNLKLASGAVLLGFFALIFGNPGNNTNADIDIKDLAVMVETQVDHVSVEDLADWIIKGKSDY